MGDRELRDAERTATQGDGVPERVRVLVERLRSGQVTREHLAVAAWLGDQAAESAVGGVWGGGGQLLPNGFWHAKYALEAAPIDHPTAVLAAALMASRALPTFEAKHPGDPRARSAIEAALLWARCPCSEHSTAALLASAQATLATMDVTARVGSPEQAAGLAASYAAAAAHSEEFVARVASEAEAAMPGISRHGVREQDEQRKVLIAVLCGDGP
jgi:hypothetical protein